MKIQFKAKVTGVFFKFPMLGKRHIVDGLQHSGRISSYSNSELFEGMLNRHLKSLGYPVGLSCATTNLGEGLNIKITPGFLHTFEFEFNDAR